MITGNFRAFDAKLAKAPERLKKKFQVRIRKLMTKAMMKLVARTPVHSGQAVANYVATAGSPYAGPVKQGETPTQATNKLPLGAERLRSGAEAEAKSTLAGVSYDNPYQNFYITNRAPQISGLEAGELPEDPYTPRSPQGMFRVTLQDLISMLESGRV